MAEPKDVLPEVIRELAKPVLTGIFASVWEQKLTLPAKFRHLFPNSNLEDPLNADSKFCLLLLHIHMTRKVI